MTERPELRDPVEVAVFHLLDELQRRLAAGELERDPVPPPDRRDELAEAIKAADQGDGAAARRVAELLELVNEPGHARLWWQRAAVLGDADAVDYVRHIFGEGEGR